MNSDYSFLIGMIILLAAAVFMLCREIVCWYFKINERLQLQKDILAQLQITHASKRPEVPAAIGAAR